jgi:catechol 2,3-dioxygenase-like lactoylglutathione lyase family enzyme
MSGAAIEIGVVVRDIDRMLAFYRDHLGYPEVRQVDAGSGTIHFLRAGASHLKLVEPVVTPDASNPPGGAAGGTGIRYLTIYVASLTEALDGIESSGATVTGRFEFKGSQVAFVEDPDGNALEIVQAPASE